MKIPLVLVGLTLVVVNLSCSRAITKADYDQGIDFSNYKSFEWMARPQKKGVDPFVENSLLEKRIKNAANKELLAKGYRRQMTGDPDFLVVYYVDVEGKLDLGAYGYGYYGGFYRPDVLQYNEGTLILDFVDPDSNELIWRGWYAGAIKGRAMREKEIHRAVRHILEKFPPEE